MEILENALNQGIAPAIVVAVYLIVVRFLDNKKESAQTKITSNLINSINGINAFLEHITKSIIEKDKEKCRRAIEDAFYASAMRIINFTSTTIINNNIDVNKDNILSNIGNIVTSEYYTIYSTLSIYDINDVKPAEIMKQSWIDEVKADIENIIFNQNLSKSDKINVFANKLHLKIQSYITYVNNNTF